MQRQAEYCVINNFYKNDNSAKKPETFTVSVFVKMANFIFYMYKIKNRIAACYMDSNISSTLPSQRRDKYN